MRFISESIIIEKDINIQEILKQLIFMNEIIPLTDSDILSTENSIKELNEKISKYENLLQQANSIKEEMKNKKQYLEDEITERKIKYLEILGSEL